MGYLLRAEKFWNYSSGTARLYVGQDFFEASGSGDNIDFPDVSTASIQFWSGGNFKKFYIYGVLNTISGEQYKSFTLTGNSRLYWASGSSSVGSTMYLVRMTYKVSYSTEHGEVPSSKSGVSDLTDATLPALTAEGFNFLGWYYESSYTTQAQVGDAISADTTLYAKWESGGGYYHA